MVDPVKHVGIVILAAGKGKRMNGYWSGPKVLVPLLGKPLFFHLLEQVKKSVIQTTPVVVIAPDLYIIRETIGPACQYAIQETQLGTGHAVLSAKEKLLKYDHVLVLYGDHPLLQAQTIDTVVNHHLEYGADATLTTLPLPHFEDWFSSFECYGRIIRDQRGAVVKIVERKDATEQQAAITEVNAGYYMFKTNFLWSALPKISRDNVQGEYYLTDVIALALAEGRQVRDISLNDPEEALGINTPEQLALVEKVMRRHQDLEARVYTRQLPL